LPPDVRNLRAHPAASKHRSEATRLFDIQIQQALGLFAVIFGPLGPDIFADIFDFSAFRSRYARYGSAFLLHFSSELCFPTLGRRKRTSMVVINMKQGVEA